MPRIAPLPEPDWPQELRPILERRPPAVGMRMGDNNIFATFARHEQLFQVWLRFGAFLLGRGVLEPRERELLILRTGYNCGSDYEWGQHVRLAESLGIERGEIMRVAAGPEDPDWAEEDRVLLRAADELHRSSKIGDQTWAALAERYDERGLLEIAMLVGQYHLVAFALNSLEVELDEGLEPRPG